MSITNIKVNNFKSFQSLNVDLTEFNVLIGANASGKSNFIQIFKFINDISQYGLEDAISMQGGIEYLKNVNSRSDYFSIELTSNSVAFGSGGGNREAYRIKVYETNYKFTIKLNKKKVSQYEVVKDELKHKCDFFKVNIEGKNRELEEEKKIATGIIIISNIRGKVSLNLKIIEGEQLRKEDFYPSFLRDVLKDEIKNNRLIIESPYIFMPIRLRDSLTDISIYDFDPKLPKRAIQITGRAALEEDASNIALVLKNILRNKAQKKRLFTLLNYMLPFVSDLTVKKLVDKTVFFELKENYSNKYLPASLLSDGTINIIALIIALYFDNRRLRRNHKPLVIIEEPERNIHPHLMSNVINTMKDASKNKQIVITTHNPEILKNTYRYMGNKNILMITRNNKGYSNITRPLENDEIKNFLNNEMGVDELYIQNLFEMVVA